MSLYHTLTRSLPSLRRAPELILRLANELIDNPLLSTNVLINVSSRILVQTDPDYQNTMIYSGNLISAYTAWLLRCEWTDIKERKKFPWHFLTSWGSFLLIYSSDSSLSHQQWFLSQSIACETLSGFRIDSHLNIFCQIASKQSTYPPIWGELQVYFHKSDSCWHKFTQMWIPVTSL